MDYVPGDRVITPTGRTGTIRSSPYDLPLYAFVDFDDGSQFFILKSILKPYETSRTNRSKSSRNRRSPEKVRGISATTSLSS